MSPSMCSKSAFSRWASKASAPIKLRLLHSLLKSEVLVVFQAFDQIKVEAGAHPAVRVRTQL
jgi:hypothetical protein